MGIWTEEQKEYLIKNFSLKTGGDIGQALGKSAQAVSKMASKIRKEKGLKMIPFDDLRDDFAPMGVPIEYPDVVVWWQRITHRDQRNPMERGDRD